MKHRDFTFTSYRGGYRTQPRGTPACISQGAHISPSTETMNFLFERNDPISLIILAGNCKLGNYYSNGEVTVRTHSLANDRYRNS